MITTRQSGNRTYVSVDGFAVAMMERSPWSGEWCYGLLIDNPKNEIWYRPPFTPTRYKTAKAAAKFVVSKLGK